MLILEEFSRPTFICTCAHYLLVEFLSVALSVDRFVPESIRWLRVNDQLEAAENILLDTARINGKPKPSVKLAAGNEEHARGSYADLFRPWPMCRDTLIQNYTW